MGATTNYLLISTKLVNKMKIPEKPPDYKKEAERRDVFRLLKDRDISELVKKANERYYYWDELKYRIPNKCVSPKQVWSIVKVMRNFQYNDLDFGNQTYHYVITDEIARKLHKFDLHLAGNIETLSGDFPMKGDKKFILNSLMEEAIASSQLEGASTTRRVAKEMLRENKKPANTSEQMIVNGYKAMLKIRDMIDKGGTRLTPEMILEIHRTITEDTLRDKEDGGRFRDNNEVVVGDNIRIDRVYHEPVHFKKVPRLIEELCEFANSEESPFLHPLLKGIILHFLMGYIHPFNDGNGRTARALYYWYVLKRGYWMFEYMPISKRIKRSKSDYDRAYLYTETDDMDLTYFIRFNLIAIEDTLEDMLDYMTKKQRELEESLKLVSKDKGLNFRQADVLKSLMKHPGKRITIGEVRNTYNVVYQTARTDLLGLAAMGYLEKTKVKKTWIFTLNKGKTAGLGS